MVMTRYFARPYLFLFAALIILVGCAAGPKEFGEAPQPVKRADRAALTGMDAYASGDYADALASFTEALRSRQVYR